MRVGSGWPSTILRSPKVALVKRAVSIVVEHAHRQKTCGVDVYLDRQLLGLSPGAPELR